MRRIQVNLKKSGDTWLISTFGKCRNDAGYYTKDEYYGLQSGGNIYDILPVGGKIVLIYLSKR
jgi:hypothetical protein